MGASLSTSNSSVVNNAVNTTFQRSGNSCNADCSNFISGVDIILVNSSTGNITFDQKCTADASCSMTNAVEAVVSAYQLAEAKATAESPILPIGLQINIANATTENNIRDEMTQVLENVCKAEINNTLQEVLVYAQNSTTGDIGFTQTGNVSAKCVMENAARMELSMQQVGKATASAGNLFGGLIGLIILIAIIMIIIGAVKKGGKNECDGPSGASNPQCQSGGQGGQGGQSAAQGGKSAAQGGGQSGGQAGPSDK